MWGLHLLGAPSSSVCRCHVTEFRGGGASPPTLPSSEPRSSASSRNAISCAAVTSQGTQEPPAATVIIAALWPVASVCKPRRPSHTQRMLVQHLPDGRRSMTCQGRVRKLSGKQNSCVFRSKRPLILLSSPPGRNMAPSSWLPGYIPNALDCTRGLMVATLRHSRSWLLSRPSPAFCSPSRPPERQECLRCSCVAWRRLVATRYLEKPGSAYRSSYCVFERTPQPHGFRWHARPRAEALDIVAAPTKGPCTANSGLMKEGVTLLQLIGPTAQDYAQHGLSRLRADNCYSQRRFSRSACRRPVDPESRKPTCARP